MSSGRSIDSHAKAIEFEVDVHKTGKGEHLQKNTTFDYPIGSTREKWGTMLEIFLRFNLEIFLSYEYNEMD